MKLNLLTLRELFVHYMNPNQANKLCTIETKRSCVVVTLSTRVCGVRWY